MSKIYTHLMHKADLYEKSITTNAAGQKKPTWTLSESGVKCGFIPRTFRSAFGRVAPTYEENEKLNIIFGNEAVLTYDMRIYNLRDRRGNILEAGPLEIDGILKQEGFGGILHHYYLTTKRAIES